MFFSPEAHKEFENLVISIHEIGPTKREFAPVISSEALNKLLFEHKNQQFSWTTQQQTQINFSLLKESEQSYVVSGVSQIKLSCPCVRCLNLVNFSPKLEFSIRMMSDKNNSNSSFEYDCYFDLSNTETEESEQIQVGYFTHNRIDLGAIVREQIYFCVPDYPQCTNGSLCDMGPKNMSAPDPEEVKPLAQLLKPYWAKKFGE